MIIMSDIKIKPKSTIKQIDKNFVNLQKTKDNLVTTKEKIDGSTINDENNSGEEYASKKVQNNISYLSRNGISKGNEI